MPQLRQERVELRGHRPHLLFIEPVHAGEGIASLGLALGVVDTSESDEGSDARLRSEQHVGAEPERSPGLRSYPPLRPAGDASCETNVLSLPPRAIALWRRSTVTRTPAPPARPPLPLPAPAPLAPPEGFAAELAAFGVTVDAPTVARLGDFLARLLAMNELVNLTAITEPAEAWSRHVLDALTLVPLLAELPAGARVLDMGSGGGVPGIPLAILRADLRFTLVDATAKKAAFLTAVASALHLDNVSVVCARAEDLARGDLRRSFHVVTARAVAKLGTLLAWTAPFAKPQGRLLLIKGARADQELAAARGALRRFGCTHERTMNTPTGRVLVLTTR